MAVVVLTSAAGSPGVTTLALALALGWPRPVMVVDADPSASQAVPAGFLGGRSVQGKGLVRVAEAHRERRSLRESVLDQCVDLLPDDPGHHGRSIARPRLLPGFHHPGQAGHFVPVWRELAETFTGLSEVEIDVLVDAGRLGPEGLPQPLVDRSAAVLLVTRTSLRAVVAARAVVGGLTEQSRQGGGPTPNLVLVGSGDPYGATEISSALRLPVLGSVVDDPRSAAVYSDGRPRPHRSGADKGRSWLRSVQRLVDLLATDPSAAPADGATPPPAVAVGVGVGR